MSKVQDMLRTTSPRLATLPPEASALDAARIMTDWEIGSVLVFDERERLVGIFTERDVLRRIVSAQRDPATTPLKDVMTSPVAVATASTTCNEVRATMRERHIRHMPIVEGDRVVGIVSIGDLNRVEHDDQERTIHYLEQYMTVM